MATSYIRHVSSEEEMTILLKGNSPVVVSFHAAWSAPCREIAPLYSQLAAKHPLLTFVKVEVNADNIQSVGQRCRLTELPTFIVITNEGEIDRIRGADQKGLEGMIAKHAPKPEPTASGSRSANVGNANDSSLLEYLDMSRVDCLNEAQDHTLKSIVETKRRNTTEAYLESDADQQLLITLCFNQLVKIRSIVIHTKDPKFGPKDIKIDINKPALGFDDVESATEPAVVQVLKVSEELVKEGNPIYLRFVRLQRVNSLHIFVESNHGDEDVTRIDAIDVYGPSDGQPATTTQMSGLRNFVETQQRGLDLLSLFHRAGGVRNLSNAILLLREALLLCPTGSHYRAVIMSTLTNALFTQYQQQGDHSDLAEIIPLCYELVELCPLGHPSRAGSLSNLSSVLLTRYEREGCLGDLSEATERSREALELCPVGHPNRAASLSNLSSALLTRYRHEGSLADLSEATEHHREALELRPVGHPDRAQSLNNFSSALLTRYQREGSLADLSEATELRREALGLRPVGHPDRALSLNSLSNALVTRYKREGSVADLSEAIERYREALELCPGGHPNRAGSLNNLSGALLIRYEREGSLADLSEATEHHREALELRPVGHPGRAQSLNNLSNALHSRYEREGSLEDLSEAIEGYREALELFPVGHPDRATSLNSLAIALVARYEREGSLGDLSEAIERYREALDLCPVGHPDRAQSLGNLSNALLTRYEREESLEDLSEATEHHREALELRPVGHPDHAASLSNFSNALLIRHRHEGSLAAADLSEATERYREALELRPVGHPEHAKSLGNLSNALLTRYEREGSLADLSEAIEHHREALELCPVGHPDRALSLNDVSNVLVTRYGCEGNAADLSEAIEYRLEALELRPPGHPARAQALLSLSRTLLQAILHVSGAADMEGSRIPVMGVFKALREAAGLSSCPPRDRLKAALEWIDAAHILDAESTLDAYSTALDQLDIVLATSSTLENKHTQLGSSDELTRCRQLGVEAASHAVRRGHLMLAVELLERGRNLLFTQVGRYRVELEELRKANAELADRFSRLSGLLDAFVVSNQPTLEGRTAFEDPTERYRRVSTDWSQAVDDIRAVKGFNNFLKAPDYATLRTAAAEGPVIILIQSVEQSDALIISQHHDEPHHMVLPEAGEAELAELRRLLIQAMRDNDERTTEKSVKKILGSLWDQVVGPIMDALENELHYAPHSRIWWCPTSFFSFLPLHAAGRYTRKDANQNLPDRYVSSYTPTVQALTRAQHNPRISNGAQMQIVAQPDTPGQGPLLNAPEEAKVVKELAEEAIEVAIISSERGTRAAVVDGMATHSWLHLICHGIQNSDNPFDSCFCLYDGQITLQEIMRSGLPDARFAYLAACHTATGDDKLSDEGLHLAAGLQFAGFKGVVGTIWKVADDDGPLLAKAFYEALLEEGREEGRMDCSRAAYALNKAVKRLRDGGAVKVNSWMRFVHIGI